MLSVSQFCKKYSISKDRVIRGCKRLGIYKVGNQYVIHPEIELDLLKNIKSIKKGNPNWVK